MPGDPLATLRAYRQLAPWNLRDLAALTSALLETARVRPTNRAAAAFPNERTIRFYVTRGLVGPPEGRGTAATYGYRHLLQVLAVKLRQMEGATLEAIGGELTELTGDVLERRVAAALGSGLPPPHALPVADPGTLTGGRAGRVLGAEPNGNGAPAVEPEGWRRLTVGPGAELHLRSDHPLAGRPDLAAVAETIRLTLGRLVARGPARPD